MQPDGSYRGLTWSLGGERIRRGEEVAGKNISNVKCKFMMEVVFHDLSKNNGENLAIDRYSLVATKTVSLIRCRNWLCCQIIKN